MAYTFPTSPTNGQKFTPTGGPTFVWNGTSWVSSTVGGGNPWSSLVLNGSTSGTETLVASAVAGTNTATFPARTGTVMIDGPAFSAYNSAAQGFASTVVTKVTFDTETYDTANAFSGSTFTCPVAGYYQISAGVAISSTTVNYPSQASTRLYKNGSLYQIGTGMSVEVATSFGGTIVVPGSWNLPLNVGDTVEIYMRTVGGSNVGNSGGGSSVVWFSGIYTRGL